MALLHLGTVLVAASSVLMTPSHGDLQPKPRLERSPAARYSAQQIEHYLSAQDIPYIRPGYRIILNSFTIPDDRKPVAEVTFLDDLDQPLDRLGKVTPGACSASFILAWYDAANRDYIVVHDPDADQPDHRRRRGAGVCRLERHVDRGSRSGRTSTSSAPRCRPASTRPRPTPSASTGRGTSRRSSASSTTRTSSTTSGRTARRSPRPGTPSTRQPATPATTRSAFTAARAVRSSSACSATTPRSRSTPTPATASRCA